MILSPLRLGAALMVCALLTAGPARADNDRMAGSQPVKRAAQNSEEPAPKPAPGSYNTFIGADDRMAGPRPADQPAPPAAAEKQEKAADATDSTAAENEPRRTTRRARRSLAEIENMPDEGADSAAAAAMAARARPVEPQLPDPKSIPINELEFYGLYDDSEDESLGIDLWHGSPRTTVQKLLPQIPARSRYRTLNRLTERLLLTHTDSQYLSGARTGEPGADLLTMRLEKLIDTGAYPQAMRLYALNPGRPYHARLARAGVTAMMYGGQHALGCLEVKALAPHYGDDDFWRDMLGICDLLLSNNFAKNQQSTAVTPNFGNSTLLQKLVDNPAGKFRPDDMTAMNALSPGERIAVLALKRMDYAQLARLSYSDIIKAEPAILAAMLADPALPARLRLYTIFAGLALGAADTAQLTAFYETYSTPNPKGWQRLPLLYQQANARESGPARDQLLIQALNLRNTYGTLSLLPFAPLLAQADPGNLTPESMATAIAVMVKAGQIIPDKWRNLGLAVLNPAHGGDDRTLTYFAYDIAQNFAALDSLESQEFQELMSRLAPAQAKIVKTIYEKLDKDSELHNIDAEVTYEKSPVLTGSDDYVMPVSGLLDSLRLAQKDKRLGEVILISSILLRSTSAGTITPEVLGEVLDGYKTVGLTREARDLASEVILGLRK